MNAAIAALTARQLLTRRRVLLLLLLALVPLLFALIFLAGDRQDQPAGWAADDLLGGLVVTTVLPLTALAFATAALGSEIDEGTILHLLAKPLPRHAIVLSKLAVSTGATALLVVAPSMAAAAIVLPGDARADIMPGFAAALLAGSLLYSAAFIFLSAVTARALIAGLLYTFLWEGVVTGIFAGLAVFSLRQYTLGIADALVDVPAYVFDAQLSPAASAVLPPLAAVILTLLAVRRLESFEVSQAS